MDRRCGMEQDRPDGHTVSFTRCADGEIEFDRKKAHRVPFDVTDTVFEGRGGIKLAGRLVIPKGNHPVPLWFLSRCGKGFCTRVVRAPTIVTGRECWRVRLCKRGTGGSEGKYTQDFDTLADDAVAAMREAKRIGGTRSSVSGIRAVVRAAGLLRSPQHERPSISLLSVSGWPCPLSTKTTAGRA